MLAFRFWWFYIGLFLMAFATQAQSTFRLYLIGDAGLTDVEGVVYRNLLNEQLATDSIPHAIIFLGDNIYPRGLDDPSGHAYENGHAVLESQLHLVNKRRGAVYFIPGNHDWAQGRPIGYQRVINQSNWFDSLNHGQVYFYPQQGCPGPIEIQLTDSLVLIILDTQWLLHMWDKPIGEDSPCAVKSEAELAVALEDIFKRHPGKQLVVAGHHPLVTYGEHGGIYSWRDHLFPLTHVQDDLWIPLPVIGSIYPSYRKLLGNIQDLAHPRYREMTTWIKQILRTHPGVVYVAGHEHSLQYSFHDQVHYVVSGAGVKHSFVRKKGYAQFVSDKLGYARLTFHGSGNTQLEFYSDTLLFDRTLPSVPFMKGARVTSTPIGDSIRVRASSGYAASKGKSKWMGENYRKAWQQEIRVPVLNLKMFKGGLTPIQKGGGMQTLSLRLMDSLKREYALRSIEKYPEKAVPEALRRTFAQDLVQDQISAAHPYGALVIPVLANGAGIYHTKPTLFYIGDDPMLGEYQKDFAGHLMLLEERPDGPAHGSPHFGNAENIISTTKVLDKLEKDNDHEVDQAFVLRNRLFDLWIGDWDRHDDQWRWAVFQDDKKEIYRPIPRDRDQAFFVNEGILPKLWSRKWALPKFQGFDYTLKWPPGFMFNARYFDRSFLNALSWDDWQAVVDELIPCLTDSLIDAALHQWPAEIYQLDGDEIAAKLRARRTHLKDYALQHYAFLAKEVDVVGTDKDEYFRTTRTPEGIRVEVRKKSETGRMLYDRTFNFSETNEIRLYGRGGKDYFQLNDGTGKIRVRVIGGGGSDSLTLNAARSGKRTLVYDKPNGLVFQSSTSIKDRRSSQSTVNTYNRKAFQYNRLAPLVLANYNIDDGIFIGGGFLYTAHGFRKDPYKARHTFTGSYAINTASYNFRYDGRFTDIVGKWSGELDLDVKSPNFVNNFFGFGNESVFDKTVQDQNLIGVRRAIDFYRIRFEEIMIDWRFSHALGSWGRIKVGPWFQRAEIDRDNDKDRFIKQYESSLDQPILEIPRSFSGLGWQLEIKKQDDVLVPSRGIVLQQHSRIGVGLSPGAQNFTTHAGSIAFYHSVRPKSRTAFGLRVGGGFNTGTFEIYQSQILDGKTELRGYRKTRFYGDSKMFINTEIRMKLFSVKSYLLPSSVGVLGFYDRGRVWYSNEKSARWHQGFGGGIWFTPFNLAVVSTELAHSREGTLAYIRLGFLF